MKYLLAAIVAALVIVPAAAAHKPAGTVPSSISLDQANPAFGDVVTFTVSSSETSYLFANVNCYQAGVLVMNSWAAYLPGGSGQSFGLYSPAWQSGAADCQADLGTLDSQGKWQVLASSTFHVSG